MLCCSAVLLCSGWLAGQGEAGCVVVWVTCTPLPAKHNVCSCPVLCWPVLSTLKNTLLPSRQVCGGSLALSALAYPASRSWYNRNWRRINQNELFEQKLLRCGVELVVGWGAACLGV